MSVAPSKILHKICPSCGKIFVERERVDFGDTWFITGECGDLIIQDKIATAKVYDFESSDHAHPRPFQIEGIQFCESSNFRTLIADEQGLGKTIQVLGCVRLHKDILCPFLIVTKTTLTHQFYREIQRWINNEKLVVQVIKSGKEMALMGMDGYICSWDMLKNEHLWDMTEFPKLVILDECQAIKNHLSGRAKATQDLCRNVPYVLATSGTPIKNNAGEYFTILNILQPSRFPHYQKYLDDYCDSYNTFYSTKVGGLSDPERFFDDTKDFIIRRLRKDVAPEIPEVDRQFFHVELDPKLNKLYEKAQEELEELFYKDDDDSTVTSMIAIMTKMRKITGISKVPACVEYVSEFLLNEPDKKIVIFAHHHDVVNLLEIKLNEYLVPIKLEKCLNLHSGLSPDERSKLVDRFKDDIRARVLIASTLAAGEGLNLQFCSRAIMLERQWNPANEEQAEGRFARIGQQDNIIVQYFLASETIDEYFTDLVEQKRAIVKNTLDKVDYQWDQNSLVKELATILVMKGKKKWSL